MNLIIDIGNTKIKIAVFKKDKIIYTESFTEEIFTSKIMEIINTYNCVNAIISLVGSIKKASLKKLHSKINLLELHYKTKVPFKNKYATPKTLGVDRIALASEAISKYPNKNVLVIDAGTCITYDFINSKGYYLGGSISPGIQMRYKSLHTFTKKLPLLKLQYINQLYGNSTETSIHLGVINGIINEIDSTINTYKEKNKNLTVVLTGGEANFLANKVKNSIFANPKFLLEGLNTILTYNL